MFCYFHQAHLLDGRASAGAGVDSAKQNLAATFVNAFVNAGFGQVCYLFKHIYDILFCFVISFCSDLFLFFF